MNVKFSGFVIYVEVSIYLLLYNLHDCNFNFHITRNLMTSLGYPGKPYTTVSPHS